MRRFACMLAISWVASCVSPGVEITRYNQRIQTETYSVIAPMSSGWYLDVGSEPPDLRIVQQPLLMGKILLRMSFQTNPILSEELRDADAEVVAEDFLALEERIMREEGVGAGLYALSNVSRAEEVHGGKRFFVLRYRIDASSYFQGGWLYLYFPRSTANERFFVAHYTAMAPQNFYLEDTRYNDFIRTLESLSMTDADADLD